MMSLTAGLVLKDGSSGQLTSEVHDDHELDVELKLGIRHFVVLRRSPQVEMVSRVSVDFGQIQESFVHFIPNNFPK